MSQGRWTGSAVQADDLPPPSSARQWFFVLLAGSTLAVLFHWQQRRQTHVIAHGALAAGCLAYLALLLYVYLSGFGTYQGPRVLSFGRYAGTWFLAWAMFVLASVGGVSLGFRSKHLAAMLLLVGVLGWATIRIRAQPGSVPLHARAVVWSIVSSVERVLPQGAKTYVIWQRTNGLEYHLISYELSPRRTNTWCWTLGEAFVENDVWTCSLSPQELAATLAEYDFVLIGHADETFWTTYQSLFTVSPGQPPPRGHLFKVERSGSTVALRQVGGL